MITIECGVRAQKYAKYIAGNSSRLTGKYFVQRLQQVLRDQVGQTNKNIKISFETHAHTHIFIPSKQNSFVSCRGPRVCNGIISAS